MVWRDKLTDRNVAFRFPIAGQAPVLPFGSFSPYAGVNFRDEGFTSLWANTVRRDSALLRITNYFDGDERIPAGYAQTSVNWTSRLNTLAGARVERTSTTLRSLSNPNPGTGRYTTWLPAFHTTYRLDPNTQLRFAYTTGLGRPSMRDQSPYEEVGAADAGNPTVNRGNPGLKPQTARNLDLLFETYASGIGVISAGVYRKNIRNQFFTQRFADADTINGVPYDVNTRVNGTGARVQGLEFAFQQRFDRWPVPAFLRPFGLLANANLVKSEQTVGQDTTLRVLPVTSTPRRSGNLGLTYDSPRVGLTATLSGNYVGPIVQTVSSGATGNKYQDVWNDAETYIALSLTQRVRGNALLYFEMNNLGNQGENSYFGEPGQPYARRRSRDFYGREFSAGLRYNY
jgi:TonB-dependent receptor